MVLNNVEFFICTNVIQMRLVCVTEDSKYFQLFSVYSESPSLHSLLITYEITWKY